MKIKTVCERTGLSDRAIRLYIENGLLAPDKTENYTGRRSFDFSEDSTHSFSVGAFEFIKDWHEVKDFYWENPPFDENTDITFKDNGTITLKDKTYTYDGKEVTEPPEPAL